jgi:hypothetical protein
MPETTTAPKKQNRKISVSETNLRSAATRLLKTRLVSPEMAYLKRELGSTATQEVIDAKVLAVRSMPWASIVLPD